MERNAAIFNARQGRPRVAEYSSAQIQPQRRDLVVRVRVRVRVRVKVRVRVRVRVRCPWPCSTP